MTITVMNKNDSNMIYRTKINDSKIGAEFTPDEAVLCSILRINQKENDIIVPFNHFVLFE